ncbi:sulfotransferase domain-containing protein [Paraglaciecola sp. 25GB23A]|uniref:sulfotransferase domain-containing protein n=1 Tax=Paraglaciecola sp. 25GB23A TaxID=3156068 RepID=UPI0032AF2509
MNVVWISSYPKSGNTWVNHVLQTAKDSGYPQGEMDVYNVMSSDKLPSICPIINKEISQEPTIVLKTHAPYADSMHKTLNLNTVAFIHVIRNPLDVLLSYINFSRIDYRLWGNREACATRFFIDFMGFDQIVPYEEWLDTKLEDIPQFNLDHALEKFSAGNGKIPNVDNMSGTWFEHSESYYNVRDKIPNIVLKYEDMLEDSNTFIQLKDIFQIDTQTIINAVNSINERNVGLSKKGEGDTGIFYNKMSSFYYVNYFSKETISNFIADHQARLTRLGYGNLPTS